MLRRRQKDKGAEPVPKCEVKSKPGNSVNQVECWISRIISFSTEYNTSGWSASQVIGEPKVYPRYGDIQGSWAPRNCTQEFLEVEIRDALYIEKISIYETYHAGAVTAIGAWNPLTQSYVSIYHGSPTVIGQSRIFEPEIEPLNFKCNRLRVDIDCTAAGTWCEIDAIKVTGKKYNLPSTQMSSLSKDMGKLVNSDLFSDVCFIIEKQEVHAHKAILVARSDYFKAMFSHNMKEAGKNEIILEDVKYDTFLPLLEYIYTGELTCSPTLTVDLLKLADMFSMEDLKVTCMSRIPEHLSVDNVLPVLSAVGQGDSLAVIRELCYDFIAQHYVEVTKSEDFQSLPKEHILEIVQLTASKLTL